MSSVSEESVQALQALNFSELEATIYTFLLQQEPTTGYRIAQALGKPVANTYKAINALQAKGAVIVDESQSRLCRAVPPTEIFGQMERTLHQQCANAAEALFKLQVPAEDARVYRLSTWEQVMERTRQMIGRAEQVILICAFPQPLEEIKPELEQAAERGVGVLLKLYQPVEVKGAQIALSNESEFFLQQFPAQELSLVVDAQEQLQAMLAWEGKTVRQAIWSSSLFLSFNHYNGLYSEWLLTTLAGQIREGASLETLRHTLSRSYPLTQTPGYHKLSQSLNQAPRETSPDLS